MVTLTPIYVCREKRYHVILTELCLKSTYQIFRATNDQADLLICGVDAFAGFNIQLD